MIFYLLHNFINYINITESWSESQKNCFTFIFGSTLYVILYVICEYLSRTYAKLVFELMTKFFLYIVVIDVITMCILYKKYFGRSILNETIPNEDSNWIYDSENHTYQKKKDLEIDELRKFNERSDELDDLRENIIQLDQKTDEITDALLYHPDNGIANKCKKDFEQLSNEQKI